jgi:hypothetical protein
MDGMTGSHWAAQCYRAAVLADGPQLRSIFLPETFYLYEALAAERTKPLIRPHRKDFHAAFNPKKTQSAYVGRRKKDREAQ